MTGFARQLRNELAAHPTAQVTTGVTTVTVLRVSPAGPDVTVFFSEGRCTLAIGGWHDDLVSMDVVLDYVKMAVAGTLRVRIDQIRGKPWKYVLERQREDGNWSEESVMVVPRLSALWARQPTTHYLQNAPAA